MKVITNSESTNIVIGVAEYEITLEMIQRITNTIKVARENDIQTFTLRLDSIRIGNVIGDPLRLTEKVKSGEISFGNGISEVVDMAHTASLIVFSESGNVNLRFYYGNDSEIVYGVYQELPTLIEEMNSGSQRVVEFEFEDSDE
jgi:hypothetical protein